MLTFLFSILLFTVSPDVGDGPTAAALHPPENEPSNECRYDDSRMLTLELEALVSESDPMLGDPEADVLVVEFFDPNCVHCRHLHPVMKEVFDKYADRIRYVRKPFALSRRSAFQVAAMLLAAEEGKFHEMVDRQLEHPDLPYLSNEELADLAAELGMDRTGFLKALEAEVAMERVQALKQQARSARVRGTPTLVINGNNKVVSASSQTVECISGFIEAELRG